MGGWTTGHSNYNTTTFIDIGSKGDTRLTNNNMFEFVMNTNGQSDTPVWQQVAQADINRNPDFTGNNISKTEIVIGTNGKHDENKWLLVTHKDIPITAGNDAWKIPLTFATGGIDMPVELEGLRANNILEVRDSFNSKNYQHSGTMSSKPTVTNIPVIEDMVVSGNWRTPHESHVILIEEFTFNTKNYQGAGLMSSKPVIVNVPVREQLVSNDQWRIPWQTTGKYEISGTIDATAMVLVIDEGSWQVVKAEQFDAGDYAITGVENKKTLAVATRVSDGESLAYGRIDPKLS
jgi:hypothetical protein